MDYNATWRIAPASNSFNDADNWDIGAVPTIVAFFGASNTTTIALDAPTTLGQIRFVAGAPAYTLNVSANLAVDTIGTNSNNATTVNVTAGAILAMYEIYYGVYDPNNRIAINLDGGTLQWRRSSDYSNYRVHLSLHLVGL